MGRAIVNRTDIIRQAAEWEREATLQEHNIFVCYDTGTLTQEEYYMYCMFIVHELLSKISK